jgi:hypothetical protein
MDESTKQVLIRLPIEVYEKLQSETAKERRSLAAQVTVILEERYRPASESAEESRPESVAS